MYMCDVFAKPLGCAKTRVEKCTQMCTFQTLSVLYGVIFPCCREPSLHRLRGYASLPCEAIAPYVRELSLRSAGKCSVFTGYGITVSGLPKLPFFTVFSLVPPPEYFDRTSM